MDVWQEIRVNGIIWTESKRQSVFPSNLGIDLIGYQDESGETSTYSVASSITANDRSYLLATTADRRWGRCWWHRSLNLDPVCFSNLLAPLYPMEMRARLPTVNYVCARAFISYCHHCRPERQRTCLFEIPSFCHSKLCRVIISILIQGGHFLSVVSYKLDCYMFYNLTKNKKKKNETNKLNLIFSKENNWLLF